MIIYSYTDSRKCSNSTLDKKHGICNASVVLMLYMFSSSAMHVESTQNVHVYVYIYIHMHNKLQTKGKKNESIN